MKGVLVGLGSGEDKRSRLRRTAVRAGWPDVFVRAHLDSVVPTIASVPSRGRTRDRASVRWNRPGSDLRE